MMRSGELARLSGVSPDTLRHYERLGLLPKPPRTPAGYRNYHPQALARVRLIRRALSIGFSLPELQALLRLRDRGQIPCHEVRRLAATKLDQLRMQIEELTAMRAQLEQILKQWDDRLGRVSEGQPARLLENIPDVDRQIKLVSHHQVKPEMGEEHDEEADVSCGGTGNGTGSLCATSSPRKR